MDGVQAGGILLVDLPGDLLDQAAESREGHTALADYLAKQVMPDVYPARAHLNGGGKPWISDLQDSPLAVFDIGHFESERCAKDIFYKVINNKFPNFKVLQSESEQSPVLYL